MIGIPIGLVVGNFIEWKMHQVLHSSVIEKKRSSFWRFHFNDHHKACRKRGNKDPAYEKPLFREWNGQAKEAVGLVAGAAVFLPLFPVAPFFTATIWWGAANYYRKHKRAHLDVEWGKENLPWHYEHHMGKDQNKNWCVTKPWMDNWLGTRARYPELFE